MPREFVVISDGTITDESKALIRLIRPGTISVQSVEEYAGPRLTESVRDFMAKSPWGAKLASIMAMADRAPSMYVDADVLCFPHASELRALCEAEVPLFMLDVAPYLDQRLLPDQALEDVALPVNAGMLFVPSPLDWTLSLTRLDLLDGAEPSGYTEQTAVHLAFHGAGAQPFPPDRYVVSPLRMRTRPHVRVRRRDVCARHYTRPQRGLFGSRWVGRDCSEAETERWGHHGRAGSATDFPAGKASSRRSRTSASLPSPPDSRDRYALATTANCHSRCRRLLKESAA